MLANLYHRPADPFSTYSMEARNIMAGRARHGPTSGSVELEYAAPAKKQRGEFHCEVCDLFFTEKRALNRHKKENKQHLAKTNAEMARKHRCGQCPREFAREHDLRRHRAEVHQAKRRKPGIQGLATMFRRRSDETLDDESKQPAPFEDTGVAFVFHGNDEASSQSSHARDTEDEDVAPDMTPSTMPPPLSRRASASIQSVLPRRMSQVTTSERPPQPLSHRHHSLVATMVEPEDAPRPGFNRVFSDPNRLKPIEDPEDDIEDWIALTENSLFKRINDEYTLLNGYLNGASNKSSSAYVAQCPICRAPHKDTDQLLKCLANDFEHDCRPHICLDCDFGFISRTHLRIHLASVKKNNHCGFRFPHTCTGHHHKDEPNPAHNEGSHDSLHERMEGWYLLQLFFKARQLSSKLDAQRPHYNPSDRRWTLAALRTKYRNFSTVSTLNVRSPTFSIVEGKEARHSSWHDIPAALEETLGKVAKRFRELAIPGPHNHAHTTTGMEAMQLA